MASQIKYTGLINALFSDVNPVPVKTAMNILGMEAGPFRQPLYPMNESTIENLKSKLLECGLKF
jgi:4-hydroxy-tetrahydrodipicolinate synthase